MYQSNFFAIVVCKRYDSGYTWHQTLNDGADDQCRRILKDLEDDTKATLALHHLYNCLLVISDNGGSELPMHHLFF